MVICALSLLAAGYTCVAADREIESAFLGGSSGFALFGWMAALSAAVILFTIGLARSLTGVLLKCERFRCRGANPFLLRQLGARLGLNAVMVGLLSFLIGFSITGFPLLGPIFPLCRRSASVPRLTATIRLT